MNGSGFTKGGGGRDVKNVERRAVMSFEFRAAYRAFLALFLAPPFWPSLFPIENRLRKPASPGQ